MVAAFVVVVTTLVPYALEPRMLAGRPHIWRTCRIAAATPPQPQMRSMPEPLQPIPPLAAFVVIHEALVYGLRIAGSSFPASVVGLLGGFAALCLMGRSRADRLVLFFEPANRLLRDWLALIYSPGFTSLPLTMPPVSPRALGSFMLLLFGGFGATTATSATIASALAPRRPIEFDDGGSDLSTPDAGPPPSPPDPYPPVQQQSLVGVALLGMAVHVLSRDALSLNVCVGAATLAAYSLATTLCSPTVKLVIHPFVTCSLTNWGVCAALGAATGVGFTTVLAGYSRGAGRLLATIIGPTVVSFSFQLYRYRAMLRRRAVQIVGSAVGSAFASMLLSAAIVRVARLASRDLRLALLSRSYTTPLALEISRTLGVSPPGLGMLAAFSTALISFPLGKALLDALNVRDPATRGLALAGAAHSGGMLALADEPEAFPVAALMVNLCGAAAVCLVSMPPVRSLLVAIALG